MSSSVAAAGNTRPQTADRDETIAFDGKDLRLVFLRPAARQQILTYSVRPTPGKPLAGFAASFIRARPLGGIFVIAKWPHWWQTPELAVVEDIIRASGIVDRAERRLAYGASMGAHGVMLTAARLGFEQALMIAPQVSLSPPVVPFEHRWDKDVPRVRFCEPDARTGLRASCTYWVLYDPRDGNDARHVALLGDAANVRRVVVPFGGHTLPEMLQQTGMLGPLVGDVLTGGFQPELFRRTLRARRPQSGQYFDMLSKAELARGRGDRALAAARRWFALAPDHLPAFDRLAGLLRAHDIDELLSVARLYVGRNPSQIRAWRVVRQSAYQTGDIEGARQAAEAVVALDGEGSDDWRWIVRILQRLRRSGEAAETFDRMAHQFADDLPFLRAGVNALEGAGRHREALALAARIAGRPDATREDADRIAQLQARA